MAYNLQVEPMRPRLQIIARWSMFLLAGIALAVVFGAPRLARHIIETRALTTGPNGSETPASLGVPFERVAIPRDGRRLDSYVVTADGVCENPPVIVIYHGVQETISEWVRAQRFLYDHCVSSVVFDYTGSGNSSRPARFEAVGKDCVRAYDFASSHFPGKRIYALGHSMGNAPMLEAVPHFSSQPAGVIVANAFASLRSVAAKEGAFYRILAYAIPDWWDNVKSVQEIRVPLLVVHSDTDQVNPVDGGREIFAAAGQPKELAILHGYRHNDLYQKPTESWWSAVLVFVNAPKPPATQGMSISACPPHQKLVAFEALSSRWSRHSDWYAEP
jgi:alpha-beta hydrolase superfamily lysophospholipase